VSTKNIAEVAVLIVGFHNPDDIAHCIAALSKIAVPPNFDVFICENGGAIYMPRDYLKVTLLGLKTDGPFKVLELGTDVDRLRVALEDAARACGVTLRTFGQMEVDEIATLTGLSLDQAARALERRYDEPFLVESGDSKKMAAMLRAKKLTVTKGDRFYHLSGGHTKRDAVEALLNLHRDQYGQVIAIGLALGVFQNTVTRGIVSAIRRAGSARPSGAGGFSSPRARGLTMVE